MVTIYTEQGVTNEALEDNRFNFGRLAAISLGTALLLSMVAVYNLNSDVNNVTDKKMAYIEQRLSTM